MDVLRLLDKLESIVTAGSRVPMTSRVLVDEQEVLDIIDQMRTSLPEELKQAKRMAQDRDRMLATAQRQVEQMVSGARQEVAVMASNTEVAGIAQRQAEEILGQARMQATEARREADRYAIEVLVQVETELQRLLAQARKGRAVLEKQAT